MNDSLHLKYLTVGPNDRLWGTAVNSVGFQEVGPGELILQEITLPDICSPKKGDVSFRNISFCISPRGRGGSAVPAFSIRYPSPKAA